MSAAKEKTFMDLEPLICDSINMGDVLMSMLEEHFGSTPEKGHYIIPEAEGDRLFFVACVAMSMSKTARNAYYEALGWDAS
ncbi:MAG: hypothetical protein EOR51_11980 [Mesorhizobium sp.]|uniref:hypothetical protein n=1 Tax=Mesorhizobium sp. TaxID=1871066 RepID=UPI000FE796A3|nr:hypothetical protein [Mesorhizobium sp.]RWK79624.1 MAG: hypothetical protein EOR50_05710 [Mesorhizobium sp.]RWK82399.1 MAG: hypothetical protein EOR51_11980 [Mesorhizobium sp.]RWL08782.1 MAG: hypothetical protein EOR55_03570 [Mesorhizobium sp.]